MSFMQRQIIALKQDNGALREQRDAQTQLKELALAQSQKIQSDYDQVLGANNKFGLDLSAEKKQHQELQERHNDLNAKYIKLQNDAATKDQELLRLRNDVDAQNTKIKELERKLENEKKESAEYKLLYDESCDERFELESQFEMFKEQRESKRGRPRKQKGRTTVKDSQQQQSERRTRSGRVYEHKQGHVQSNEEEPSSASSDDGSDGSEWTGDDEEDEDSDLNENRNSSKKKRISRKKKKSKKKKRKKQEETKSTDSKDRKNKKKRKRMAPDNKYGDSLNKKILERINKNFKGSFLWNKENIDDKINGDFTGLCPYFFWKK